LQMSRNLPSVVLTTFALVTAVTRVLPAFFAYSNAARAIRRLPVKEPVEADGHPRSYFVEFSGYEVGYPEFHHCAGISLERKTRVDINPSTYYIPCAFQIKHERKPPRARPGTCSKIIGMLLYIRFMIRYHNNMNYIDLHIHSTYSDGSMTPGEIVGAAAVSGLRVIALTDHDTIGGVQEALRAAEAAGTTGATGFAGAAGTADAAKSLTVIPGVEISAYHEYPLHLLGYFGVDNYRNIDGFLKEMRYERNVRNDKIIEKLNMLGIKLSREEVVAFAGKEVFGRLHIAAVLVKKGVSRTLSEAFYDYLSEGRKAYVKKLGGTPRECVRAIADAGGLPVVAHPGKLGMRLKELKSFAKSLADCGLYGIEAYYPDNTPAETANYLNIANELGLIATGGSDFHGAFREGVKLGSGKNGNLFIPDDTSDAIFSALRRKSQIYRNSRN